MLLSNLVKNMLVSGDFSDYFSTFPPSAREHPESVVLLEGEFGRESRIDGEERGTVPVRVLVVREDAAEAEELAIAMERHLRNADWEPFCEAGPWRIVGLDTTAPVLKERDSSGRYVWKFTATLTVAREI
ncbi:MAG: hypothetical protein IJ087_05235 [Eggerthellaceae bacterium]|nr:hypothetical protein [Eggerthellaceae bacterium]